METKGHKELSSLKESSVNTNKAYHKWEKVVAKFRTKDKKRA